MTEERIVGKPVRKDGIDIGIVTGARPVVFGGRNMWEITADCDIELDFPTGPGVEIPPTHVISYRSDYEENPRVAKFLLAGRSPDFLDRLDYATIQREAAKRAIPIVRSNTAINPIVLTYKQDDVIGHVLKVEQISDLLIVVAKFNEHMIAQPDDRSLAYSKHRLKDDPDCKVGLAWAGMLAGSAQGKHETVCFYLHSNKEI